MSQTEKNSPAFIAYHVRDGEDGQNGFWTRIGAAWKHKDGDGFTLQLELVPVASGRITLRTPQAKPQEQAA